MSYSILWLLFLGYVLWRVLEYINRNINGEFYNPEPLKREYRISYIDEKGYRRYKHNDYLVHRDIAFHKIYKKGFKEGLYPERFSFYEVHHIDRDKLNNSIKNLQILTREEHKIEHGIL